MGYKIAIVGPESTGKSWLCEALAKSYNGTKVPEVAREYLAKCPMPYTREDVETIAKMQLEAEKNVWDKKPDWLFCDTSLLVIEVWMEHKFGHCPDWIKKEVRLKPGFDLYLLTYPDLGWMPDPLREHPRHQFYFWEIFKEKLEWMDCTWLDIRGVGDIRLENAIKLINQQLDIQSSATISQN